MRNTAIFKLNYRLDKSIFPHPACVAIRSRRCFQCRVYIVSFVGAWAEHEATLERKLSELQRELERRLSEMRMEHENRIRLTTLQHQETIARIEAGVRSLY